MNEDLGTTPTINITTSDGGVLTSEDQPLSMLNNNINNPDLGPLYTYDFSILSNTDAGDMTIRITMEDESSNVVEQSWSHLSIDAQLPVVSIFAPTPSDDGSKYLYGNRINVLAGAEDDVVITSFQYRFTYHFGGISGSPVSTPGLTSPVSRISKATTAPSRRTWKSLQATLRQEPTRSPSVRRTVLETKFKSA